MSPPRPRPPGRSPARRYHHGDLPRAMVRQAVRLIQTHGVEALTLRGVAARLGVSRTALYRHFANKEALLAAVAAEGFRTLRAELAAAYEQAGRGTRGFDAMGVAYVQFALRHPSHYRVMFGGFVSRRGVRADDAGHDTDAFRVLLDAIVEQQQAGLVRAGDPRMLAVYVWAVVHGVAMLALDRMLASPEESEALTRFAIERLRTGLRP